MRTLKAQLEHDIGQKLEPDAVILQWLVRWAGISVSRYMVGKDGKTAYERIRTISCSTPIAMIGEKVMFMLTQKKTQAASVDTPYREGIWAGIASRTGETIILTEEGAVRAWTVRRMLEKDRWDAGLITRVRGTLAQPNPNMPGQHVPIGINIPTPANPIPHVPQPQHEQPTDSRIIYLRREDFENYGLQENAQDA